MPRLADHVACDDELLDLAGVAIQNHVFPANKMLSVKSSLPYYLGPQPLVLFLLG